MEAMFVAHTQTCETHWESIDTHLATSNGTVKDLVKFKIQAQAIITFMAFTVSLTAGTLITLLVTKVL